MTWWMTSPSASRQTSQLIPSDVHNSDLNNYGRKRSTAYLTERRNERNETLEEEEEARPPYLHVSSPCVADLRREVKKYREANLSFDAVYDCGWHWWDYRRSSYAFNRYRQDPPARRSKHASEVYLFILVILDNFSARRPA